MTKNVKKLKCSIKKLEVEKKSCSKYGSKQYLLDIFEDEEESSDYEYESVLAQIKLYDCEIKRLKNILCC